MKKIILSLLCIVIVNLVHAKFTHSDQNQNVSGATSINTGDTLIFDLSRAYINGNHAEIPVRFLSDDIIYSVDFSLKYNHNNLDYDSISNLTNYIQPLSFYNTNDSTLRFTSSSLQSYQNDSSLILLHFTLMNGNIQATDLLNLKAYLNGDKCSIKVMGQAITGLDNLQSKASDIKIFPNPAKDFIVIESTQKANIKLIDIEGRNTFYNRNIIGFQKEQFDINGLKNGIYLIRIITEKGEDVKKLIIEN